MRISANVGILKTFVGLSDNVSPCFHDSDDHLAAGAARLEPVERRVNARRLGREPERRLTESYLGRDAAAAAHAVPRFIKSLSGEIC